MNDKIKAYYVSNDIDEVLNYIDNLEQENARLKENNMSMQEEMVRTWEKVDLYKEVIEEVRKYAENDMYYTLSDGNTSDYTIEEAEKELLQILDKVKD